MHVAHGFGKLIPVTAATGVLRSHWLLSDCGKRLLRFIAALMVGLTLTVPVAQSPAAAQPSVVRAGESVTVGEAHDRVVTLRDSVPAPYAVRDRAATPASEITSVLIVGSLVAVLIGRWPGVRGERAPPTA